MKKTFLIAAVFSILLTATSCGNNSDYDALKKENEELKNELRAQTTTDSEDNNSRNFDKYNILSFELYKDDRDSYDEEVIQTYTVTNNSEFSLKEITIDVAYYDENGNIVCDDSRINDILVLPGKSVDIDSYSYVKGDKKRIHHSEVVSYTYKATEDIAPGHIGADVNVLAKDFEWYDY